jgi:hypothetical protein
MKKMILFVLGVVLICGAFWLGTTFRDTGTDVQPNDDASIVLEESETDAAYTKYTNDRYGFSFMYDRDWRVEDIENGAGVRVFSNIEAEKDVALHDGASVITIDFLGVPTDEFSDIQTKVGDISYSERQKALVDTLETPPRCLPVDRMIGEDKDIPLFLYSASAMSTPTYEVSAIVTNTDYLIVSNVVSYEMSAVDSLQTVYESFSLAEGVEAAQSLCDE